MKDEGGVISKLQYSINILKIDCPGINRQMIRVGFGANSKKERSINAMKSIGCKVEGILRQFSKDAGGKIIDAIKLSISKDEWEENVKNN